MMRAIRRRDVPERALGMPVVPVCVVPAARLLRPGLLASTLDGSRFLRPAPSLLGISMRPIVPIACRIGCGAASYAQQQPASQ
jgi:hypothetical protein